MSYTLTSRYIYKGWARGEMSKMKKTIQQDGGFWTDMAYHYAQLSSGDPDGKDPTELPWRENVRRIHDTLKKKKRLTNVDKLFLTYLQDILDKYGDER